MEYIYVRIIVNDYGVSGGYQLKLPVIEKKDDDSVLVKMPDYEGENQKKWLTKKEYSIEPYNLPFYNPYVKEIIKKLKFCQHGDSESAHIEADRLLCDLLRYLGYSEVVTEFEKISKWYA